MKNWFLFGTGFFLGVLSGAFLASFLLFDDMVDTKPAARQAQAATRRVSPSTHKAITAKLPQVPATLNATSPAQHVERPVAVPAQPVDLTSLPPADETTVVATAPSDRPNVETAP